MNTTTAQNSANHTDPLGIVTSEPRKTCAVARFGQPHVWLTGAFYLGARLVTSDDYFMCGACGQVEYEGEVCE